MSTLVAPACIVARKPTCGCVVASTAATDGLPNAVARDIAAWQELGLTVERIPRRDLRALPWARLGNGWCVHDSPHLAYDPAAPRRLLPRTGVAHEGRRVGRHSIPSTRPVDVQHDEGRPA